MAGIGSVPSHAVSATIHLAGEQRTGLTVHNAGTPEAVIAVTLGRSLIYMHSTTTTERFARIWDKARDHTLRLPGRRKILRRDAGLPAMAEPSVVVHTAGSPEGGSRLIPGTPFPVVRVQVGGVVFVVHDRTAFDSCATVFRRAADEGHAALKNAEKRLEHLIRSKPTLAGEAAERAAAAFTKPAPRPEPVSRPVAIRRFTASRLGIARPRTARLPPLPDTTAERTTPVDRQRDATPPIPPTRARPTPGASRTR